MKVNKVDHICIAVKNLDEARKVWEPLLGKDKPDDAYVDEPEKIRVFLEAIWKRINTLERSRRICAQSETCGEVVASASRVTHLLRQMKTRIDDYSDTQDLASDLFDSLRRLTMIFLQIYFDSFGRNLNLIL